VRSCCEGINEVLGIRIGAKELVLYITVELKNLKVRINLSVVFYKNILDLAIDSP
jgi:hypothetical protein